MAAADTVTGIGLTRGGTRASRLLAHTRKVIWTLMSEQREPRPSRPNLLSPVSLRGSNQPPRLPVSRCSHPARHAGAPCRARAGRPPTFRETAWSVGPPAPGMARLFVSQGIYGIETGGFSRGIKTKEDADQKAHSEGEADRADGDDGFEIGDHRHKF